MHTVKTRLAAIPPIFLPAACSLSAPGADVQARRQSYLDELPVGASATQIEEWQARHGVTLDYNADTASYSSTNLPDSCAEVKAKSRICDSYFLVLTLKMDGQNRLQNKELSSLGSCI